MSTSRGVMYYKYLMVGFWASFLIVFYHSAAIAQNEAISRDSGLSFKLVAPYVCGPDEIVRIQYQIRSENFVGALLGFSDSGRVNTYIVKNDSTSFMMPYQVKFVVGYESVTQEQGVTFLSELDLSEIYVDNGDNILGETFQFSDGDSIYIISELATTHVGLSNQTATQDQILFAWQQSEGAKIGDPAYDKRVDFNNNGFIDIVDHSLIGRVHYFITNHIKLSTTRIAVKVYLRINSPDINRDKQTDFSDFVAFANSFGSNWGMDTYNMRSDFDGNGKVEFKDFIEFVRQYGG